MITAGAFPPTASPPPTTTPLQEAVKVFQRRHGLHRRRVLGRDVVAEMNVPVEHRIAQIRMNMERWRWLPRDLGNRYILVNIPEMRLDVYEGSRCR